MQRYLRFALITLGIITLQTTIIPFTSIANIIPDLLLIWIVYVAITEGQVTATLIGFLIGLTVDFISGQFLGLSALSKTIAGFLAGYFYHENKIDITLGNYQFLVITGIITMIHNIIYFGIFVQGSEISLFIAIFRFGLLSTLYTTTMALLPYFIFSRKPSAV